MLIYWNKKKMITVIVSIFCAPCGLRGRELVCIMCLRFTSWFRHWLGYQGQHYDENRFGFNAELIENAIVKMKGGKAAGLDGITCEHLLFSHPLLPGMLAKSFNFMIRSG